MNGAGRPGFYFAGMKSYGRAPTFLMLTGYETGPLDCRRLAGDHKAGTGVEWCYRKTGVCSRSTAPDASQCCGGPAPSDVDACFATDANAGNKAKPDAGARLERTGVRRISLSGRSIIAAMCVGQLGSLLPHVVVPSILAPFLIPEWHLTGAQPPVCSRAPVRPAIC